MRVNPDFLVCLLTDVHFGLQRVLEFWLGLHFCFLFVCLFKIYINNAGPSRGVSKFFSV